MWFEERVVFQVDRILKKVGLLRSRVLSRDQQLPGSPEPRGGCGFLLWLRCKESACSVGRLGSVPWRGRSPGEGNGHPLQYSCLENSVNRGAGRGYSPWGCKDRTEVTNAFTFKRFLVKDYIWCLRFAKYLSF